MGEINIRTMEMEAGDLPRKALELVREWLSSHQVRLDRSRTCVYWNDEIDLPSDIIYEYGKDALEAQA